MKSVYNFVVTPKGERYNNSKKIGDKNLILNTEIFNHQYVNREAVVVSTPIVGDTDIKPGDIVIVPQFLWHYTEPNKINFKKRVLSFDFTLNQ